MFAITPDGKIVKNITKNQYIERFLPTSQIQKLRYYTKTELEQNEILSQIDKILNLLETEISEYEEYLVNFEKQHLNK